MQRASSILAAMTSRRVLALVLACTAPSPVIAQGPPAATGGATGASGPAPSLPPSPLATPAPSAAPQAQPQAIPGGPEGFHLEPKATIDDVFGDTGEYRRIIDRFLVLGEQMQRSRDEFAHAVQVALQAVAMPPGSKPDRGGKKCPVNRVAQPYARALQLGKAYLSTGRELSRRFEQVREFDRLGESLGLTPDYRQKVKRVLALYSALLVDYREMKFAFHDQLTDELKYAGCDLEKLLAAGTVPPEATLKDEPWPTPAEFSPTLPAAVASGETRSPGSPGSPGSIDPPHEGHEGRVDLPRGDTAKGDPVARSGILFYVDNTRCSTPTTVALDGQPLGEVPGATRSAFQAAPGPHDLCLLPRSPGARKCGDAGTLRKSYLHEGWTISLRCE
jgi:hypothetical protein